MPTFFKSIKGWFIWCRNYRFDKCLIIIHVGLINSNLSHTFSWDLLIGTIELNLKINLTQPIISNCLYLCKAFQHSRCHPQTITPKVNKTCLLLGNGPKMTSWMLKGLTHTEYKNFQIIGCAKLIFKFNSNLSVNINVLFGIIEF